MTSLSDQDCVSPQSQNSNMSPTVPWCIDDDLSDCSLFPSPICDEVATPGAQDFWSPSFGLGCSSEDNFDSLFCQAQGWDYNADLDLQDPINISVAPSALIQNTTAQQPCQNAIDLQLPTCSRPLEASTDRKSNCLSPDEIWRLTAIAMDQDTASESPVSSCSDDSYECSPISKSASRYSPKTITVSQSPSRKARQTSKPSVPKRKISKSTHNQVEKKYRTHLSSKIVELRERIPCLREQVDESGPENEDRPHITKAKVLTKAIEYINDLENTTNNQEHEIRVLKSIISMYDPNLAISNQSFKVGS